MLDINEQSQKTLACQLCLRCVTPSYYAKSGSKLSVSCRRNGLTGYSRRMGRVMFGNLVSTYGTFAWRCAVSSCIKILHRSVSKAGVQLCRAEVGMPWFELSKIAVSQKNAVPNYGLQRQGTFDVARGCFESR